ncbi:protein IQ-DOMAIN 2-like isoform X2 [Andrographis paniculata]|uniref:protein IQ-DOMAIN 2-like isoform X2 n=1 Tax=Andrographis paniculata TaxID=175694 RepID=UPI0021E94123|nr:protein IQ-DOMAIN 2-like isoform X2 [Andrographis paniculata]
MERKGSWFSSVKKALSPDSKGKKDKKASKSKKWFGKEKPSVSDSPIPNYVEESQPQPHAQSLPPLNEIKLIEDENEQAKHTFSVAVATTAEIEVAADAQAAAEVVWHTKGKQFAGKSKEEVAAIKIQTAFRGYLARRALRALRGLVRLKSLVDGPTAYCQTANALKCMQTLSRVQSQVQSRRLRMLEENRALQRQILQKHAKELESLRMGDEWDDSLQSKEQVDANLLHKYEAAMRRERALAYSYTHQQTWKKSSKTTNLLFMDPTNPHWGWSWLERWMAAQPLNSQSTSNKDPNNDRPSIMGTPRGEITKSFAHHQLNSEIQSSPATPKPSGNKYTSTRSPGAKKLKPPSPRASAISQDDDSRSMVSVLSERNRRHTIAGTSVRDDESFTSSASVPSYMVPTQSTKAKLRSPSLPGLGVENGNTPEKIPAGAAKKRLSFPPSPARAGRRSGPPKVVTAPLPTTL